METLLLASSVLVQSYLYHGVLGDERRAKSIRQQMDGTA